MSDSTKRLAVVGISGSPSKTSKSRMLVEYALAQLAAVDRAVAEALKLATAGLSGPGPRGT